jgi:hypothetical protein
MSASVSGVSLNGISGTPTPAPAGKRREALASVTFDASYPTGGYALTAGQFGLTMLEEVQVSGTTQGGLPACWVVSTGKLKVFSAVGTEETATTDLHTDSILVKAYGF